MTHPPGDLTVVAHAVGTGIHRAVTRITGTGTGTGIVIVNVVAVTATTATDLAGHQGVLTTQTVTEITDAPTTAITTGSVDTEMNVMAIVTATKTEPESGTASAIAIGAIGTTKGIVTIVAARLTKSMKRRLVLSSVQ